MTLLNVYTTRSAEDTFAFGRALGKLLEPADIVLLHGDLDVELRSDLTVLNLPAVLASRGNARCLYFSDEAAAYALYAPDAAEDVFLSLIPRLSWVEP